MLFSTEKIVQEFHVCLPANTPAHNRNHLYIYICKPEPAKSAANELRNLQNIYHIIQSAWGVRRRLGREGSAVFSSMSVFYQFAILDDYFTFLITIVL